MSTSILLSDYIPPFRCSSDPRIGQKGTELKRYGSNCGDIGWRRRKRNPRVLGLVVPKAKGGSSWWRRFFLEEEGNWLGLGEGDLESGEVEGGGGDEEEKFEAWKKRAEAIIELREAQEGLRNEESSSWEDWLDYDDRIGDGNGGVRRDWEGNERIKEISDEDVAADPSVLTGDKGLVRSDNGLVRSVKDLVLGTNDDDDDDLLYEDRVFRYASRNSAKFLAILIIIPWALDFAVHDYVFMPFLARYVKTVPLAAEMLEVRRNQKLQMVKELKTEKARLSFEMEIGKSPPLSDEEMWSELHHKALDMREEWRLENRKAFANILSDAIYGISLFVLLYFNQSKVALLKFTGYKLINNISDTGKAFLIILITDIFLGYHSESGWETVCEIIVEHYGLEVDKSAITIFICLVPVIMDACVKLWLFKFLPSLSPKVSNIFQEMKRH